MDDNETAVENMSQTIEAIGPLVFDEDELSKTIQSIHIHAPIGVDIVEQTVWNHVHEQEKETIKGHTYELNISPQNHETIINDDDSLCLSHQMKPETLTYKMNGIESQSPESAIDRNLKDSLPESAKPEDSDRSDKKEDDEKFPKVFTTKESMMKNEDPKNQINGERHSTKLTSSNSVYENTFDQEVDSNEESAIDLNSIISELQNLSKENDGENLTHKSKDSAMFIPAQKSAKDIDCPKFNHITDLHQIVLPEECISSQSNNLDTGNISTTDVKHLSQEKDHIAVTPNSTDENHTKDTASTLDESSLHYIDEVSSEEVSDNPKPLMRSQASVRKRNEWIAQASHSIDIASSPNGGARPKVFSRYSPNGKQHRGFDGPGSRETIGDMKSLYSTELPFDEIDADLLSGGASLTRLCGSPRETAFDNTEILAADVEKPGGRSHVSPVTNSTMDLRNKIKSGWAKLFTSVDHMSGIGLDNDGGRDLGYKFDDEDIQTDTAMLLDLEQLLMKLELPQKTKIQIKQASQISLQRELRRHGGNKRDKKRKWKSLDERRFATPTPPSTPTSPKEDKPGRARRWSKLPMAIKMMGQLSALRKKQPSVEEDRLSLEFFVPGRKTTIRLHRRTFFNFILKYSIFFFTFIFWIGSLSSISFSAWMLTTSSVIIDEVTDVFLDPYVMTCVIGTTVFIVSFVGCLGALRENIFLLKSFHFTLTAVIAFEVLASTLIFLFYTMPEFRAAVKVGPEDFLKRAVQQYFDDDVMKNWIDTVQEEFSCCGVSLSDFGYKDWQENPYFNCSTSNPSAYRCSVPVSCCIFEDGNYVNFMCGRNIMDSELEMNYVKMMIHTKGCMKSFGEWLSKNDGVIFFTGLGLIILQILGVVAARYFIKNLREGQRMRQQSDRIQIGPSEE